MSETIVLGGGCFWCTEAVFSRLKGVKSVVSGYAGGKTDNPDYEKVSTGMSGYAEVIKVDFNPEIISLEKLLGILKEIFDLTAVDRQGNDVGSQYRSVILYTEEKQKSILDNFKKENPEIVTGIEPLTDFYTAEAYHQKYFENNSEQPYCRIIIGPKLKHLEEKFSDLVRE